MYTDTGVSSFHYRDTHLSNNSGKNSSAACVGVTVVLNSVTLNGSLIATLVQKI